ncbi:MAG: DUF1549 domain-containing protein [Planctomycetota bacterium]|nr:DUF1549 domain-containing protein [Planctomycetota bacterium]
MNAPLPLTRCPLHRTVIFAVAAISIIVFLSWSASADTAISTANQDPVAHLDALMRTHWEENEISPSSAATEGEWCRRVFLDVIGRIPTLDELDTYLNDNSDDKKSRLVDRLLSDQYSEAYTRNWANIWTNVLIGRSGGSERNSRTNRRGMQVYLEEAFGENRPYDQVVTELINARGTSRPPTASDAAPDFNGAVNFLAMKLGNNPNDPEYGTQATAKTSQIFLGRRVQCTQCHDHPFNRWKQNQFWEFNAFFRQTVALRRFEGGRNIAFIQLAEQDFQGPTGEPEEAEIFYDRRNGVRMAAYPVFTDRDGAQTELARSGFVEDVDRRAQLASLVRRSGYLPEALVNRYWAHFFSHGFTQPFDDMGPHNLPSHPDILQYLSEQFVASGYDLKQLIRGITLSEAYGLSSRLGAHNEADDPALGEAPLFSRFYPRQMRAEQLYDSLLIATRADKTGQTTADQERKRAEWLRQFVIAFGTDENDEKSTFNGTIPQVLSLFNGDLIQQSIDAESGSFLGEVIRDGELTPREKMDRLFLAAFSRKSSAKERRWANRAFANHESATAAFQDVWWTLLNTNEFILNH